MTRPEGIEIKKLVNNSFPSRCVPAAKSLPWFGLVSGSPSCNRPFLILILSLAHLSFLPPHPSPCPGWENAIPPHGKCTVQDWEGDLGRTRCTLAALLLIEITAETGISFAFPCFLP